MSCGRSNKWNNVKSGIWILTYSKQLIKAPHGKKLTWCSDLNYVEILRSRHAFREQASLLRLHFRHGSPETNQTETWHPALSLLEIQSTDPLSAPKALTVLISQYQSIYYSLRGRTLWSFDLTSPSRHSCAACADPSLHHHLPVRGHHLPIFLPGRAQGVQAITIFFCCWNIFNKMKENWSSASNLSRISQFLIANRCI